MFDLPTHPDGNFYSIPETNELLEQYTNDLLKQYHENSESLGTESTMDIPTGTEFTPAYDCFAQIYAVPVSSSSLAIIYVVPDSTTYCPCTLYGHSGGRLAGMCLLKKGHKYTFTCTNTKNEKLYYYPLVS